MNPDPRLTELTRYAPSWADVEEDRLAQQVFSRLMTTGVDELDDSLFERRQVSEKRRREYERLSTAFESWAREGGYLDPSSLSEKSLEELVTLYLHNLARRLATNSLHDVRTALGWWAEQHGLANPVTPAARRFVGSGRGIGQAQPLSDTELSHVLTLLADEAVVSWSMSGRPEPPGLVSAWHARQLAAVTTMITASMRAADLHRLTDQSVTAINEDGIFLAYRSKKGEVQNILRPRDDLLCPCRAVAKWLSLCSRHEAHRPDCLLFPAVHLHRSEVRLTRPGRGYENEQWDKIRLKAGLTERHTPHGHRAAAPTRAASANWDPARLRDLGSWSSITTAALYVRTAEVDTSHLFDRIHGS